jgi:phosphoglycolate phosphatase
VTLFWDIDGTLLTTDRAGAVAWEDAVRDLTGRPFDLSAIRIAGLTDYQIAVEVWLALDVPADATRIAELVRAYEARLPERLPQRNGRVLPNVREILLHVQARDDIRSYLLTGNTRQGARAKLGYYGLSQFFNDGAFAEDTGDRESIARRGLELARRAGPVAADRLFVIGDTPHDIRCANAIGARTLAVATGGYTVEELEPHHPWRIVSELPAPPAFLDLLQPAPSSFLLPPSS